MNRRTFASGVIGILATPLAVRGQPGRKDFRIGFLLTSPREVQSAASDRFGMQRFAGELLAFDLSLFTVKESYVRAA